MRGGKNVLTVPEVQQIATAHSVVPAQVGLKWIVQHGLPLTTASEDAHWSTCPAVLERSLMRDTALGQLLLETGAWRPVPAGI